MSANDNPIGVKRYFDRRDAIRQSQSLDAHDRLLLRTKTGIALHAYRHSSASSPTKYAVDLKDWV